MRIFRKKKLKKIACTVETIIIINSKQGNEIHRIFLKILSCYIFFDGILIVNLVILFLFFLFRLRIIRLHYCVIKLGCRKRASIINTFVPRESRRATIVIFISSLPSSSSNFDRSKSKFRWFDWTKDGNGVRAKLERCSIWRGGKRRVEGCKSRLGTFTRDHALLGASYELPSHLILLFTFLTDPSTELRPLTEMLLRVIFCD